VPTDLPIRFADKPDANALSGIWKDNPVTIEDLRKKAWGEFIPGLKLYDAQQLDFIYMR